MLLFSPRFITSISCNGKVKTARKIGTLKLEKDFEINEKGKRKNEAFYDMLQPQPRRKIMGF